MGAVARAAALGGVAGKRHQVNLDSVRGAEAVFNIPFARRNSAFSRRSRLSSADSSVVTPGRLRRVVVRRWADDGLVEVLPTSPATGGTTVAGCCNAGQMEQESDVVTEHWNAVYERMPATQVGWFQPEPTQSLQLLTTAQTGFDDAIVDVGGGASVLVDHLVGRGFRDVTVLDVSADALQATRSRLGAKADNVAWITSNLLRWQPVRRYRVWHDRAVFHFLTAPADRARYVEVLRAALAPGGHVIIGTFAATGPQTCSGLPVARYSPEDLARQFPGFAVRHSAREEHYTPGGAVQPFTWLLLALDDEGRVWRSDNRGPLPTAGGWRSS